MEKEWGYWDEEIKNDSHTCKLDFLIEEAQEARQNNKRNNLNSVISPDDFHEMSSTVFPDQETARV